MSCTAARMAVLATAFVAGCAIEVPPRAIKAAPHQLECDLPPFTVARTTLAAEYTDHLAVADLDADNDPDLVLTDDATDELVIFWTDGEIQNVVRTERLAGGPGRLEDADLGHSMSLLAHDLDADGDTDLALANNYWDEWGEDDDVRGINALTIFLNDGAGHFLRSTPLTGGGLAVHDSALLAGDVDGDGDPDVVRGGPFDVFINDGAGEFSRLEIEGPGVSLPHFVLVDVDGDALPDVVARDLEGGWYILRGAAGFVSEGHRLTTRAIFLADLDGGGAWSVVTAMSTPDSRYEVAASSADDLENTRVLGVYDKRPARAADFDSDGDVDLLGAAGPALAVFTNDGTGAFRFDEVEVGTLGELKATANSSGVPTLIFGIPAQDCIRGCDLDDDEDAAPPASIDAVTPVAPFGCQ